jgi:hypothetical protein
MTELRPRRIVRRAVMVVAVVVLLVSGYVGSFLGVQVLDGAGWLPRSSLPILIVVYQPLSWYVTESDLPGAKECGSMTRAVYEFGSSYRE